MQRQNKTVSVIMAVYNTPIELVKRAINSVLNQDLLPLELIVIDDGSDADFGKHILHYRQFQPVKIRYHWHANCGQSQSINKGVRMSEGNYIAIIDSDDEYKPNHISACLHEMYNADLICSLTETIVDKYEDYFVPHKDNHRESIHVDDCILFATLFGRKEVFNLLSFKNMYAADADFYEQAALHFRIKKVNLRTYIYYRNIHNSISAKLKQQQLSLMQ